MQQSAKEEFVTLLCDLWPLYSFWGGWRAPQVMLQSLHLHLKALEGPSSDVADPTPILEGPSGALEALVRPQAVRESNKFFLSTKLVSEL